MRLRISLMTLMAVVTGGMAWPALAAIPDGDFSDGLTGWTAPSCRISMTRGVNGTD